MDLFAGLVTHKRETTSLSSAPTAQPSSRENNVKVAAARETQSISGPIATVGDGGASWKQRALKRARERAQKSGESLQQIVQERFSSVEELMAGAQHAKEWRRRHRVKQDRRGHGRDGGHGRDNHSDDSNHESKRGLRLGRDALDTDIISRFRKRVSEKLPSAFEEESLESREVQRSDKRPAKRQKDNVNIAKKSHDGRSSRSESMTSSSQEVRREKDARHENNSPSRSDNACISRQSSLVAPSTSTTSIKANANESAAQALRARLLGESASASTKTIEPEMVAPFDAQGRRLHSLIPGHAASTIVPQKEDLKTGRWKGKVKVNGSGSTLSSANAGMGVMEMVAAEREGGVDMDEVFARNVMRLGSNYKGNESRSGSKTGFDEDEDVDMRMFATDESRMTSKKFQEQQRQRAIKEHKNAMAAVHSHPLSLENPSFKHHLVVSRTDHAYVMVATRTKLVELHCFIVPIKQVNSTRCCQEEVLEDIQNHKSTLRRAFGASGMGVVFIETFGRVGRHWAKIEAIPVPLECEMDAPLYFKQALGNIEGRLIDLGEKTITKAIPANFPYFSVEWSRGGLVLAIEDTENFQADFGQSVLCGMMGLDPPQLKKRGMSPQEEKRAAAALTILLSEVP